MSLYLSISKENSSSWFNIFNLPFRFTLPILKQFTPIPKKTLVKSNSDWIKTPGFSEKSNLIESLQSTSLRLIFIPTLSLVKHISSNEVINPPDDISCPDRILSSIIKSCIKLNELLNFLESLIVGDSDPILLSVWPKDDPPNL